MFDGGCRVFGVFHFISFQQSRPVQRRQKIFFNVGKLFFRDGISRDQNNFDRLRQFILMPPETFAEQPPRAIALHRAAYFFARDDAQFWFCAVGQFIPICNQTTLREAAALLPDPREIATLRQPRVAAKAQAFRRFGGHARKLNRRQAFASDAAAIGERGFAALGRIAVEKSVLPFASDFRRLILAFHKINVARVLARNELWRLTANRFVSRSGCNDLTWKTSYRLSHCSLDGTTRRPALLPISIKDDRANGIIFQFLAAIQEF